VEPPSTERGFGPMAIKEWRSDRSQRKSSDSLSYSYLLTMYSVEPCSIPRLPYIVFTEGKQDTFYSEMKPIRVVSLLAKAGKDSVQLRDLKAQQMAGKPSLLWLWLLLGAAGAIGIVFLVRHLYRKFKSPPPPPPPKPPYEEAIEALQVLEARQYPSQGLVREYVFEMSDIFKRYIGRRFEVNAAEFTTEEMHAWIKRSPLGESLRRSLSWFFNTTDPIKFARLIPEADTLGRFGTEVRSFLEETKPQAEPAVESVQEEVKA
jgi:hypothetical protein